MRRFHFSLYSLFVATSFADGTGDLWWLALERAIAARASVQFGGETIDTSSAEKRYVAWDRICSAS